MSASDGNEEYGAVRGGVFRLTGSGLPVHAGQSRLRQAIEELVDEVGGVNRRWVTDVLVERIACETDVCEAQGQLVLADALRDWTEAIGLGLGRTGRADGWVTAAALDRVERELNRL